MQILIVVKHVQSDKQMCPSKIVPRFPQDSEGWFRVDSGMCTPGDRHPHIFRLEEQRLGGEAQAAGQPRCATPIAIHGGWPRGGSAPVSDVVFALLQQQQREAPRRLRRQHPGSMAGRALCFWAGRTWCYDQHPPWQQSNLTADEDTFLCRASPPKDLDGGNGCCAPGTARSSAQVMAAPAPRPDNCHA